MNKIPYEASIADLQDQMAAGKLTAQALAQAYLDAIATYDDRLCSVIETNPQALEIAAELDRERAAGRVRGPLHGIPVLLKDNIDTDDQMETTAGSLALLGTRPGQDATVAARLRQAGALILGKANLSEWANFRSTNSTSGWSARGGQCRNPYDLACNPCGSSSGSAVAVSANLATVALGTETDGSIVCPSATCGIVGIKPTVGLVSRAGVIPIAPSQDTVGPMARTVADAAAVLGALTGVDERDRATAASDGKFHTDYRQFLNGNGLRGARIGVARQGVTGYHPETDQIFARAIQAMGQAGAEIIDPADIPIRDEEALSASELTVLLTEIKYAIADYLNSRIPTDASQPPVRTLADIVRFNQEHAAQELVHFGQELFEQAVEKGPLDGEEYLQALATGRRLAGPEGLDAVLHAHDLDALVAPTGAPAWPIDPAEGDRFLGGSSRVAAVAGYPLVTVPAGFVDGLPVGLTFMGRAWSEPTLIRLAYAFEQLTKARRRPKMGKWA